MSRNQSPIRPLESPSSSPIGPEDVTPVSGYVAEMKTPAVNIPVNEILIAAIIENQRAKISDVKDYENRHISDIKRKISGRITHMASSVENMVTSLQETLIRQKEMKQAKKDLYKKAAIAMVAMAAGPFYKVAEESVSAAAYIAGVITATITGLVAAHRENTDEILDDSIDEDPKSWVAENAPNAFMQKVEDRYHAFLDFSKQEDHLKSLMQQAWDSILEEKRSLPKEELADFLTNETRVHAALDARLSTLVTAERKEFNKEVLETYSKHVGKDILADRGDLGCLYASVIGDLCSKTDKKQNPYPLFSDTNKRIVNPDQFTSKATIMGDHKILGKFLQNKLNEQFATKKLESDISGLFDDRFPNVKREGYNLYNRSRYNYKRVSMVVAMKVIADKFNQVPISMVSEKGRKDALTSIITTAMATPQFNTHKVNPVIWLLRNSNMGRTLMEGLDAADISKAFDNASVLARNERSPKAISAGASPSSLFSSRSSTPAEKSSPSFLPVAPPFLPRNPSF